MPKPKKDPKLYELAEQIARQIIAGVTEDPTKNGIFFAVYEDGFNLNLHLQVGRNGFTKKSINLTS